VLVSTAMACEPHRSRAPWPPNVRKAIPRTMRFAPLTTSYKVDGNTAPYLRHRALSTVAHSRESLQPHRGGPTVAVGVNPRKCEQTRKEPGGVSFVSLAIIAGVAVPCGA
jgi:hypothetical protein